MLNWSSRFNICCFLDNNDYPSPYNCYEALLATEALEYISLPAGAAFPALQQLHDDCQDWLFGHLGYDLKQETARLASTANGGQKPVIKAVNAEGMNAAGMDGIKGSEATQINTPAAEGINAPGVDEIKEPEAAQTNTPATEGIPAAEADGITFPDIYFFRPRVVMLLQQQQVSIGGEGFTEQQAREIYKACLQMPAHIQHQPGPAGPITPESHLQREDYLQTVRALQEHIHRGDCYEVNFCRDNFIRNIAVHPLTLFDKLNRLSPAPLAAYYRVQDQYLLCSSPERFLQQQGPTLISQPIKGTTRRLADPTLDAQARETLYNSPKERAENVMVVDLVRNDLAHTAAPGSVAVEELYGIYSFAHVHHMISTVKATRQPGLPFTAAIQHAFPMGSMTGAPKIKVMQLIDQYEPTRRGLFSGAVGYITPEGDFDLNVVIRSILYNATSRYLSFPTGSAITFYSDPVKEWEECLLKAEAMLKVLTAK